MGDVRYNKPLERLRDATDRAATLRALSDDDVIQALAAASHPGAADPYLANVLASEALNRLRRARAMSQFVADAILEVDAEGVCVDANPAAFQLLGRAAPDLIGQSVANAVGFRADRDAPGVALAEDPFGKERLSRGETHGEGRIRRGDGTTRAIAFRSAPVTVDGDIVGAIVAMRDVSEETRSHALVGRSEARQRALLDSVPDHAMALLSPQGIVETWNEGARRIHAVEAGEVIGRHFRAFYTREDQSRQLPEHELALAARHGRFHAEEDRVRRDGTTFKAIVDLAAIRDEGGIRGFALVEMEAEGLFSPCK